MIEIWKDVPNYEEFYQVSNLGRAKALPRKKKNNNGYFYTKARILKLTTNSKGYVNLTLVDKNHKKNQCLMHRIVATIFLENSTDMKMTVNHKNGIKTDNRVENLEWLTREENITYGFNNDQYPFCKKIKLINKNTNLSIVIKSMSKASKYMNKNQGYICRNLLINKTENKDYKWEILV